MLRRPPSSTRFPYTTLFRSHRKKQVTAATASTAIPAAASRSADRERPPTSIGSRGTGSGTAAGTPRKTRLAKRSEEHTSELQSLRHLVCRLLLEKQKK